MVVRNFEGLEHDETGKSIGSQSISVIRALQKFLHEDISRSLCLETPFFGAIKVANSCALQPLEGERLLGANGDREMSFSQFDQSALSSAEMRRTCTSTSTAHAPAKAYSETAGQAGSDDSGNYIENIDRFLQLSGGHFQPFDDSFTQKILSPVVNGQLRKRI